ncbi:hypothetical protein ACFPRL_03905 [Pseudoclavibacter helvolus]
MNSVPIGIEVASPTGAVVSALASGAAVVCSAVTLVSVVGAAEVSASGVLHAVRASAAAAKSAAERASRAGLGWRMREDIAFLSVVVLVWQPPSYVKATGSLLGRCSQSTGSP